MHRFVTTRKKGNVFVVGFFFLLHSRCSRRMTQHDAIGLGKKKDRSMTRPNKSTTLDKHSLTHTKTPILWFISLLLRGAYCGCGDSQNNRFFPQCHPGLQAHYTDWSIQPNLIHNTQDPRSVCLSACGWAHVCRRKKKWVSLSFVSLVSPLVEVAIISNQNSIQRPGFIQ